MHLRCTLVVLFSILTATAFAASQSAQKSLGSFGVWQAYSYEESGNPVCYMVKAARIPAPKNKKFKRGQAFLMITHRPAENSTDVVSYATGYNLKAGSDLNIRIGKNNFDLFTQKDSAWSRDSKTDHALATAIRSNTSMKATGVPVQNVSAVTDTLDLRGAAEAYRAINKACGMEVPETPKKQAQKHPVATKKPVKKH